MLAHELTHVVQQRSLRDGHDGKAYKLSGGESLSTAERVKILGDALGRELRFGEQPVEEVRQEMLDSHMPVEVVDSVLAQFAAMVDVTPEVSAAVREVTGRAPFSYADWASHRAADFR